MLNSRAETVIRDEWLPDPEVWQFTYDCLEKKFNVDAANLDERWVPLGIVGALKWIEITSWWVLKNSGITATGEQYEQVHAYDGTDLDPASLLILRHLEERAQELLRTRWTDPGLEKEEKGEVLGFISRCCYQASGVPTPPKNLIFAIAWAAMIWTLTEKGQEWVQSLSKLFFYTRTLGVSYTEGESTYDQEFIEQTSRGLGECASCGHTLWCVQQHCLEDSMVHICYNCVQEIKREDERNGITRLRFFYITWNGEENTMCSFDERKENLNCANCSCPYAVQNASARLEEFTTKSLKKRGSQRLLDFEDSAASVGGVFGRSPEELVNYFS